jgi:hypothetical protein
MPELTFHDDDSPEGEGPRLIIDYAQGDFFIHMQVTPDNPLQHFRLRMPEIGGGRPANEKLWQALTDLFRNSELQHSDPPAAKAKVLHDARAGSCCPDSIDAPLANIPVVRKSRHTKRKSFADPIPSAQDSPEAYATSPVTALMCSSSLFPCASFFLVWDRLRNVVYPPEDAAREAQKAYREWFEYQDTLEAMVAQQCVLSTPPVLLAGETRVLLACFANGYACRLRPRFQAVDNVSVEKRYAKRPHP